MRYGQLPDPTLPGCFLYCAPCGLKFSASRGDYFLDSETEARCETCNGLLFYCRDQAPERVRWWA